MGINAQATQVGTGRPGVGSVTMWIVMAIVVSLLTVGVVMALRDDAMTPARQGTPPVTQDVPFAGTGAPGGYVLEHGGVCHQCR